MRPQTDGTNASTGPRTDSGKATSSRNAETHGLTSARFILPEEDRDAFTQLLENLLDEHSPASETERLLVLQIAQSFWQEQRSCPPAARLLTSEPDRRMQVWIPHFRRDSMAEETPTPARLEAFSDGVIAVIITVMVLDLK